MIKRLSLISFIISFLFFILLLFENCSFALTLAVVPSNKVCMVSDKYVGTKPLKSVNIDGKEYFVCSDARINDSSARYAKDPVTGKAVDKADAVIVARLDGKVIYLESMDSYKRLTGTSSERTEQRSDYVFTTSEVVSYEKSSQFVYCGKNCEEPSELKAAPRVPISVSISVPASALAEKEINGGNEKANNRPESIGGAIQEFEKQKGVAAGKASNSAGLTPGLQATDQGKDYGQKPIQDNAQDHPTFILFNLGSSELTEEAVKVLDSLPKDKEYRLTGYTCPIGGADVNNLLATARANAVKKYLNDRGVAVISAEGKSKCCYVTDSNGKISYEKSRRVEIQNY